MKKWQHVFWDWNGTLLDDVVECIAIINLSLDKRGLPLLTLNDYLEKFQFPVKKYYEAIGFDFNRESFECAGQEYISAYSERMFACRLHDWAVKILAKFQEAGKKQYVLSALNAKALDACIEKFGLNGFFSEVRGLDDHYAFSKVELGRSLVNDLAIRREDAVLIGDTLHDFEVAQELGIDCILVAAGHNSIERLKKCSALVLKDLSELHLMLDEII